MFLFGKIHKLSTKDTVVYSSVYTISKPEGRFIEELPKVLVLDVYVTLTKFQISAFSDKFSLIADMF
jgi:hypothetical protein